MDSALLSKKNEKVFHPIFHYLTLLRAHTRDIVCREGNNVHWIQLVSRAEIQTEILLNKISRQIQNKYTCTKSRAKQK